MAFLIDSDLTAILAELEPEANVRAEFPATPLYMSRHPEPLPEAARRPAAGRPDRPPQPPRDGAARQAAPRLPEGARLLEAAVSVQPGHRLDLGPGRPGDALRPGRALPPLGPLPRPPPPARRPSGGPGLVRLPDRAAHRRRDAGAGRGVQRHDPPPQRHLCRPRTPGPGAQPAAGPLRAAGRRRLPRRGRGARDQQPAGLDRLLRRGAGGPPQGARSPPPTPAAMPRWSATTRG